MEENMKENILVINPGSTSTKIAIFNQEGKENFKENVSHSTEELSQFHSIIDQAPERKKNSVKGIKEAQYRFKFL